MFRRPHSLALMAAAAFAGLAAQAWAGPSLWTVDKAASKLGFRSTFAGQPVEGVFKRWDAQISFDPKALGASKAVVSVDMTSAATGDSGRDQALPTRDWFDAVRFPRATFTTAGFKELGGGRYQAQGVLSLRGVSRPVTLPFTLAVTGEVAKMTGVLSVNRSLFGVGQGQFKSAETVPFDVTVNVALTARRAH
jgi:polyisoprenoid-binding protein YceI